MYVNYISDMNVSLKTFCWLTYFFCVLYIKLCSFCMRIQNCWQFNLCDSYTLPKRGYIGLSVRTPPTYTSIRLTFSVYCPCLVRIFLWTVFPTFAVRPRGFLHTQEYMYVFRLCKFYPGQWNITAPLKSPKSQVKCTL